MSCSRLIACKVCGRAIETRGDGPHETHSHPDPQATYRERLEEEARMFGYKDRATMDANFVSDLLGGKAQNPSFSPHEASE